MFVEGENVTQSAALQLDGQLEAPDRKKRAFALRSDTVSVNPGQLRNLRRPLNGISEPRLVAQVLLATLGENGARDLRYLIDMLAFNLSFENGAYDFFRFA